MRKNLGSGFVDNRLVATNVVVMFMGVEDLGDFPARIARNLQALRAVQRIDCECLASLAASDQIVKVAICIGGPDLLDDQWILSSLGGALSGKLIG
jgi:hypothetical protein